jgi:ABC-2 type transport system permease protein
MSKQTIDAPVQRTPEQQSAPVAVSAGGAARQNTLRNIGLIIPYEYKRRVTQRSFIITTIILLVLIILASFVPTVVKLITTHTTSQTKIAVVNNTGGSIGGLSDTALSSYINTSLNGSSGSGATTGIPGQGSSSNSHFAIQMASASAINSLQQQVKNGSLGILLVIDRAPNKDLQFTYYTTSSATNDSNYSQVQSLANQLSILDKSSRLGLTPSQTASLFAPPPFSDVNLGQVQSTRSTADIVTGYILAYVGFILIYIAVIMYGAFVANGVAEEKGSRIMEILVNAATPFQLMVGKVIGIGAAGLTQMGLFVVVGIGMLLLQIPLGAMLPGSAGGIPISITGASITMLVLILVYFILGFSLYATLFAALGALVKRQDEVQSAIQPLTMLIVAGYLVNFFGVYAPNSVWMRVISYIPFWTPMAMLVRVGVGTVAWWEIPLTIVLMLAAILVCAIIAGRIYRFGVLMYGQRPGLRQLARLVRTG